MVILGISAFYHDSAAALLVDGRIVAAAQEERFSRKKHDPHFPENAVHYVLAEASLTITDIDHVVLYVKPFLKFERLLETYVAFAPKGFNSFRMAIPVWLLEKLFLKDYLHKVLKQGDSGFKNERLRFCEHHLSHAASAFYPSPFEEAIVLVLDDVGEWATSTVAVGRGNKLEIIKELHFPHSLDLLNSAFTYYTGFKVNDATQIHLGAQKTHRRWCGALTTHRTAEAQSLGIFWTKHITGHTTWFAWIVGHMKLASSVAATLTANLISDMPIKLKKSEPETGIQGQ